MRSNPLRILAVSGSIRAKSRNTEVLLAAAHIAPDLFAVEQYTELAALPHFNPDLDVEGSTPPPAVARLRAQLGAADAWLISSPEYAHGVPGSLKNALDWLVSAPELPGKPVGLLTVSEYSVHAPASLVEILRTMSAQVVPGATRVIPLNGQRLDAAAILREPGFASGIREALEALRAAAYGQSRDHSTH